MNHGSWARMEQRRTRVASSTLVASDQLNFLWVWTMAFEFVVDEKAFHQCFFGDIWIEIALRNWNAQKCTHHCCPKEVVRDWQSFCNNEPKSTIYCQGYSCTLKSQTVLSHYPMQESSIKYLVCNQVDAFQIFFKVAQEDVFCMYLLRGWHDTWRIIRGNSILRSPEIGFLWKHLLPKNVHEQWPKFKTSLITLQGQEKMSNLVTLLGILETNKLGELQKGFHGEGLLDVCTHNGYPSWIRPLDTSKWNTYLLF